jgi:hypothetical protein
MASVAFAAAIAGLLCCWWRSKPKTVGMDTIYGKDGGRSVNSVSERESAFDLEVRRAAVAGDGAVMQQSGRCRDAAVVR